VAGYNPINEPGDPTGELLMPLYLRLRDAIRAIDPRHRSGPHTVPGRQPLLA
jgi:endoglucanase